VADVRLNPGEDAGGELLIGIGGPHKAAAIAGERVFRDTRLVGRPDAVDGNQSGSRLAVKATVSEACRWRG
jgi:hypothetical protein